MDSSPTNRQSSEITRLEPWLFWLSCWVTCCTLALVSIGGLVTSKGVGMSVPDWPTSYGYNMFLFPPSQWVGGIFHEHLHRLVASGVGLLTAALAISLQWKRGGSVTSRLGWTALGLVIFQGVLGGLRVVLDSEAVAGTTLGTVFGLVHACTGQLFFALLAVVSLRLSAFWDQLARLPARYEGGELRWALPLATLFIFAQLALGACMRHQHAGLAIYDFPLAYGEWWPATDPDSLVRYNQVRPDESSVTAFQIYLQMAHRIGAMITFGLVLACGLRVRRVFRTSTFLSRGVVAWLFFLACQVALGISTVVYNKPADVATAHVAVGAVLLAWGMILSLVVRRLLAPLPLRSANYPRRWSPATAS